MKIIGSPQLDDYPSYAAMYLKLVAGDGLVLQHLHDNVALIQQLFTGLPEAKLLYRYEAFKWTIKEILVHLVDDERIYAYRALRFARNDRSQLIGFDQDMYAEYSRANERSLAGILEEYSSVRHSTLTLFENLPDEALDRRGIAPGTKSAVTPRALLYHIAGHEMHHLNVIKEKYL